MAHGRTSLEIGWEQTSHGVRPPPGESLSPRIAGSGVRTLSVVSSYGRPRPRDFRVAALLSLFCLPRNWADVPRTTARAHPLLVAIARELSEAARDKRTAVWVSYDDFCAKCKDVGIKETPRTIATKLLKLLQAACVEHNMPDLSGP